MANSDKAEIRWYFNGKMGKRKAAHWSWTTFLPLRLTFARGNY